MIDAEKIESDMPFFTIQRLPYMYKIIYFSFYSMMLLQEFSKVNYSLYQIHIHTIRHADRNVGSNSFSLFFVEEIKRVEIRWIVPSVTGEMLIDETTAGRQHANEHCTIHDTLKPTLKKNTHIYTRMTTWGGRGSHIAFSFLFSSFYLNRHWIVFYAPLEIWVPSSSIIWRTSAKVLLVDSYIRGRSRFAFEFHWWTANTFVWVSGDFRHENEWFHR